MSNTTRPNAYLYMLTSMFFFAAMSAAIHGVVGLDVTQMVFIRNILVLVIMTGWMLVKHQGFAPLKTNKIKQHFWRSLVGVIGMHFWFASLVMLPLNTAMAISFTVPIFGTILAVLLLGERAGWRRWLAVLIGFAGVLIVVRPDGDVPMFGAAMGLCASATIALTSTMIKSLTKTEHTDAIIYYMALFMMLFSAPLGVYHWQPVSQEQFLLLVLVATLATAAHQFMTRAFSMMELVKLIPIDYMRLIFTAALAYLFFGEVITADTIIGAVIIMGSTFYIAKREAVRSRPPSPSGRGNET